MRNRFDEQLELLNVELIRMGALCEDAISYASRTLMGEGDFAEEVYKSIMRSTRRSAISRISACGCFCSSSQWQRICARFPQP